MRKAKGVWILHDPFLFTFIKSEFFSLALVPVILETFSKQILWQENVFEDPWLFMVRFYLNICHIMFLECGMTLAYTLGLAWFYMQLLIVVSFALLL